MWLVGPLLFAASWLSQVENRVDKEAVEWLQKELRKELPNREKPNLDDLLSTPCKNCGKFAEITHPTLYIFMSFSLPDTIWIEYAMEMKDLPAVFVVRGLPRNSFQTFAEKIASLKEKGMNAPIQINPPLFREYAVDAVPTILYLDESDSSKVSGAISLSSALEIMNLKEKFS